MLSLTDIHASYGAIVALNGISLEVMEGEIVCLLGANGAGKSTTLRLISGLLHPSQGEVLFEGTPIHSLQAEAISRLRIAHVPEGRHIFPGLTVRENLMLGTSNRGKVSKAEMNKEIDRMFTLFKELERLQNSLGWTLSGGEQQMLAIARGLMSKPKLLMLDEPSLGLAPIIVKQVFTIIKDINQKLGTTVLLVEQNATQALKVANRGYVLETGSIVLSGDAKDILNNPEVRNAYLGAGRSPS